MNGLTVEDVDALTGDDVMFWLNNQFMTPELLAQKVCYWVTRAIENTA